MPQDPNPTPSPDERLESWKEIASYLKKGVRTVQRWERNENLPIHRLGQGLVFAYKSELDAWWQQHSRSAMQVQPDVSAEPAKARPNPEIQRIQMMMILGLAVVIAAGAVVWGTRPRMPASRPLIPLTTDHGWEGEPSFSPDGRQIVYTWIPPGGRPSIYKKTAGAEPGNRLTDGTDPEGSPAWSPDGRFIAFLRRPGQGSPVGIMLKPLSGGSESQIAELTGWSRLSWSADGKWLLAIDGPPKAKSIVVISAATGAKHALTQPYEFGYQGAALSSDLRRLVYARGGPGPTDLYEQALGPGLVPYREPPLLLLSKVWSTEMLIDADRSEIIYTDGSWEEGSALRRQRIARGSMPELIHEAWYHYATPGISADGRRLVFAVIRSKRENTWRLSLSDPKAPPVPVLSSTHSDLNPAYSPDGSQIAFHSTRAGASDIWIADRDGANPRRLTFTNARTTATPRWSPDGEWIALESDESGQSDVYVVRSSGGPIRRLTDSPALDAIPSWSRDGKTVYFCSDRTGRFEVWKMPASGGQPVQVTHNGGFSAVEAPDGQYLYYSQTRNLGPVMRMPLAGGQIEVVIPDIRGLFYAVSPRGIYFQANNRISFWDSATGRIDAVFTPPKPMGVGMAVSTNGQSLLFTQKETEGADLYMIDGLR